MADYRQVQEIARAALMADFFAVRIDEEGLFDDLKSLLANLQMPGPVPAMNRIKAIAASAADATAFISAIKQADLFPTMRDILMKVRLD
jgi:hypothetical protein